MNRERALITAIALVLATALAGGPAAAGESAAGPRTRVIIEGWHLDRPSLTESVETVAASDSVAPLPAAKIALHLPAAVGIELPAWPSAAAAPDAALAGTGEAAPTGPAARTSGERIVDADDSSPAAGLAHQRVASR